MTTGSLNCSEEDVDGVGDESNQRLGDSVLRSQRPVSEGSTERPRQEAEKAHLRESTKLQHARELDRGKRKQVLDDVMETQDMDNSSILQKLQQRLDRVGYKLPQVEVTFKEVSVSAEAFVANRVLPSIPNYFIDIAESGLRFLHLSRRSRQKHILRNVSGSLKPGRFTLLLGPPGSGKSTLLKLLAGKLQNSDLEILGDVRYNGYTLDEFVAPRTAAYIDQNDEHMAQLTVSETLDFAARCQGAGFDEVWRVEEKEKAQSVEADMQLDAFMKASALKGKQASIVTDYTMRMLGLEACEDTIVGDQLVRGISGGQKKRVTAGEMLVSPKRVIFGDEISTGLDSSTTYQIVRCLRNVAHLRGATLLLTLLQPAPETFQLFDDIMLLAEGQVVYHGPKENILEFFEEFGFHLPHRKGVADFLQEVTGRKDQRKFWKGRPQDYRYVKIAEFVEAFQNTTLAAETAARLEKPLERSEEGKEALVYTRFALTWGKLMKACMRRESIIMKRNQFIFFFRLGQVALTAFIAATIFVKPRMDVTTIEGAQLYLRLIFFTVFFMCVTNFSEVAISVSQLSVYWKQKDNLFFPATCFVLPTTLLRLPNSAATALLWTMIVYWTTGFTYSAGRFFVYLCITFLVHSVASMQFRAVSGLTRSMVLANTASFLMVLLGFLFGGLIVAKRDVPPWWRWAVWVSPYYYAQKALSINEFHNVRWGTDASTNPPNSVGHAVLALTDLDSYGLFVLIAIGALLAYFFFYNGLLVLGLKLLSAPGSKKAVAPEASGRKAGDGGAGQSQASLDVDASQTKIHVGSSHSLVQSASSFVHPVEEPPAAREGGGGANLADPAGGEGSEDGSEGGGGMTLPFAPMLLTFSDICYFVDLPPGAARGTKGAAGLQLLDSISGVFEPGKLTALMGATGAGKTTLLDVLAGRKTSGRISGEIRVNGFGQELQTFRRVSGYCEQFDIHSPQSTIGEALYFSARLRLGPEVPAAARKAFTQEIMDMVELTAIRDALVGKPGVSGLSVEQRKRLTIAVELVANPSVVFMDEPTSGLDARAAAIVMRVVRNICSTGRTICCTIHQPSIDVFESFDELVLLKRGGKVIYSGKLGTFSADMVSYFESIPNVPRIIKDFNPATWMLDISTISAETRLGLDLADVYKCSNLYQQNRRLIEEKSQPAAGAKPLAFATEFPQPFWKQYFILLAKNSVLYFRSPEYTAMRLIFTFLFAMTFGTALWMKGDDTGMTEQLERVAAIQYLVVVFYGFTNASTVQPIVSFERLVFYRERYAGMYSSAAYALAQGDVEIPYLISQSLLYSVITYWLIGYDHAATKFFWYLLFMTLSLAYYTYYGMMVVSVTSTLAMASTVSVLAYALWNLLAGFICPKPKIPGWWIWLMYTNPVHWSFYGLVVSQLGNEKSVTTSDNGVQIEVADYIGETYGLHYSFIGWVALICAMFIVLFRGITIWALCKLTFGRR